MNFQNKSKLDKTYDIGDGITIKVARAPLTGLLIDKPRQNPLAEKSPRNTFKLSPFAHNGLKKARSSKSPGLVFSSKEIGKENKGSSLKSKIESRLNTLQHQTVDFCNKEPEEESNTLEKEKRELEDIKKLELQWQDLILKQESLEYSISIIKSPLRTLQANLSIVSHIPLSSFRSKLLFLLRRLFIYPHEEMKVLSADISQHLDGHNDESIDVYSKSILFKLYELVKRVDERTKMWGREYSGGWNCEIEEVLERGECEARKEDIKKREIASRLEEIEMVFQRKGMGRKEIEEEITKAERAMGLSRREVVESLGQIYRSQLERIKVFSFEKVTQGSKKKREMIGQWSEEMGVYFEGKYNLARGKLQNEAEVLEMESDETLASFLFAMDSFTTAVEGKKLAESFSLDLLRQSREMVEKHFPSLNDYFSTMVEMHYEAGNFETLSGLCPVTRHISRYILMVFQQRMFVNIASVLQEKMAKEDQKVEDVSNFILKKLTDLELKHLGFSDSSLFPLFGSRLATRGLKQKVGESTRTLNSSEFTESFMESEIVEYEENGMLKKPSARGFYKTSSRFASEKIFSECNPKSLEFQYTLLIMVSEKMKMKSDLLSVPLVQMTENLPPVILPPNPLLPISLESISSELEKIINKIQETEEKRERIVEEIKIVEMEAAQKQLELKKLEEEAKIVKDMIVEAKKKRGIVSKDRSEQKIKSVCESRDKNSKIVKIGAIVARPHELAKHSSTGAILSNKPKQDPLEKKKNFNFERKVIVPRTTISRVDALRKPRDRSSGILRSRSPPNCSSTSLNNTSIADQAPILSKMEEEYRDKLILKSGNLSSKNQTIRKLIKHLSTEFNLVDHAKDWITRGLAGVTVRKGPKLQAGYTGSKRVDVLLLWKHRTEGRLIEIEKMGFALRSLRFNPVAKCFELRKACHPRKSSHCVSSESLAEGSSVEQLEGFVLSVDEVKACNTSPPRECFSNSWGNKTRAQAGRHRPRSTR